MAEPQDLCANDELLQLLLLGKLPREEAARLQNHVLECRRCGERLAEVPAEDTLVEAARDQATLLPEPEDAEAQALVERLCQLPMPATGIGSRQSSVEEDLNELQRFMQPAQSADELGRVGKYRVLRILGAGGMGMVMEAEDIQLGRRVALKVMKPLLAFRATWKARFLREARAAAAVQHDHVVTILQVDEQQGLPYLAMPLLNGESLQRRLAREGKLPPVEAVRIGRQIALGLSAAHQQGVVHRDIKPDNIWLEPPHDRVKILDFGLAQVAGDDIGLTQSGAIAGTPVYMSPEQARGEPVDHRADLFSLGCVLYRMCAGRPPFSGSNTASVLLAVTQEEPPPLARLATEVPPGLSEFVAELLRKDPRRRVQSAAEVVAALEAIECGAQRPHEMARSRRWRTGWVITGIAASLILLAAVIFRLATDRGTLVLELDQPDATVTIDGRQISIQAKDELVQIALSSGKHELLVAKDGFRPYSDHFALKRGDRVEIKVHLEPPQPEPADLSQTPKPAVASSIKASITPLAGSEAMMDWVRNNVKTAIVSDLARDLSPQLKEHLQAKRGGSFDIGNGLTKSEKRVILGIHDGHYFVCQFQLNVDNPVTTAAWFSGTEYVKRAATDAKLLDLDIENADDLDRNQEVRGWLKLQSLCDKKANYAVRLTFRNLSLLQHADWVPTKDHGIERIRFRLFPLSRNDIKAHGPLLVFADLCVFPERDDENLVVVSDPLPALVKVR
jgi:serine/threonine protein kinase